MGAGGGRLRVRIQRLLPFFVGTVVSAVPTYWLVGLSGVLVPQTWRALTAAVLLFASAFWYLSGRTYLRFGRNGWQARREAAFKGSLGKLYFGFVLGIGLLTEMSTPLVWAGLGVAFALTPAQAALYGFGFAFGRSLVPISSTFFGSRVSVDEVGVLFVAKIRGHMRWVGSVVSTGIGLLVLGGQS